MYVRAFERAVNGETGRNVVFDGWFPKEIEKNKIFSVLTGDIPGKEGDIGAAILELKESLYGEAEYCCVRGAQAAHEADEGGADGAAETLSAEKPGEDELSLLLGDLAEGKVRAKDGLTMVIILPGEMPYSARIADRLEVLQRAVGGYIEITYPFGDNCIVIGNEEAKLIGMQGNRRINGELYAGPLLIAGDDNEGGFCDMTPAQVRRYVERFKKPEYYSAADVEDSIYFRFFAI